MSSDFQISEAVTSEALRLALAGQKIEALVFVRSKTPGMGLAEAKALVEELLVKAGQPTVPTDTAILLDLETIQYWSRVELPSKNPRHSRVQWYLDAGYIRESPHESAFGAYVVTARGHALKRRLLQDSPSSAPPSSAPPIRTYYGTAFIAGAPSDAALMTFLQAKFEAVGIKCLSCTDLRLRDKDFISSANYILIVRSKGTARKDYGDLIGELMEEALGHHIQPIAIVRHEVVDHRTGELLGVTFRKRVCYEKAFQTLLSLFRTPGCRSYDKNVRQARDLILSRRHIIQLVSDAPRDRLRLVCGAGISVPSGFPSWGTLLERMLTWHFENRVGFVDYATPPDISKISKGLTRVFANDPLIVAKYLKQMLGESFYVALQASLYPETMRDNALIQTIGALCASGFRSRIEGIVTFNYDDLIERELRRRGVPSISICRVDQTVPPGVLPIYHIHGFVPEFGSVTEMESEIVLDEEAYHKKYKTPTDWSTRILSESINRFRCVFLGTSLTDPNMRRILGLSTPGRYQKAAFESFLWDPEEPDANHGPPRHFIFRRRYQQSEIGERLTRDGVALTSADLDVLIGSAEGAEQSDAATFGMAILWFSEFSQLPSLLGALDYADPRSPAHGVSSPDSASRRPQGS